MPVVFVPGRGNVQFPDDMDMDTIRWTIENRIIPGVSGGAISAPKAPEGGILSAIKGIATEIGAFPERTQRLLSETVPIPGALYETFGLEQPESPVERARREALYGRTAVRPLYEQQAAEAEAEVRAATPEFEGMLPRAAYSAASSLAQMAPGIAASILTRSPAPAYANIAAITAPEAYGRYRERGGSREEALTGAGLETGIEVATEMLPLGFVVNKLGKAGFGEFLRGFLGRELLGEEIATVTQGAVDTAIANPDKTWGDYLRELPAQMGETAIATGLTAGTLAGVSRGLQALAPAEPGAEAPPEPGVIPPPAAPVTPPGEGLLGLLGQEGGTIRLREGDTEVPYVFRGIDDTGRILLEGGDGVLFAEDPADIADVLVPPAAAPGAPPAPEPGVAPPPEPEPTPEPVIPDPAAVPAPEPAIPEPEAPAPEPVAPIPEAPLPEVPAAPEPAPVVPVPPVPGAPVPPAPEPVVPAPGVPPIPTPAPPTPAPGAPPAPAPTPAPPQPLPGIPSPPAPAPTPPPPGAPKPAVPKTPESNAIAATPTEELASVMRGLDVNQAIEYLSRNATIDADRQIATRVSNMLKFLQQSGYSFNFGVYGPKNMGKSPEVKKFVKDSLLSSPGTMGVSQAKGKKSAKIGAYGFGRGLIGVRDMDAQYPGTSEQTILHEYIHAVSQAVIAQYERGRIPKNSRVGQAVQDLIDLSIEVRQHKNQILADIKAGKPVDPELAAAVKRLQNTNAFADAHELIAQGLSNYDMQLLLKSLPYKNTNGFVEFIKKIGQMLGITEKDENALRRLIEVSEVIIPSDFKGKKDVALAAMRPYDYAAKALQGVPSSVSPAQAQPEEVTSGVQESELPFTPSDTGEGANLPKLDFSKKGLLGTYKRDVEMVPISWLQSLPGNELRRTPEQMDELQRDIEENGINDPVIINVGRNTQTAELGEGNHRLEVARRLGYTHLPARVSVGREYGSDKPGSQRDDLIPEAGKYFPADVKPSAAFRSLQGDVAPEAAAEPTAPAASEILTPEEEALRITSEAATEPAADSMETIKEAAQPSIRLYNIRSELQEKNRGCD